MARNEDGEFELVLGNKQLLSVFGILVILLGIFFTMGYIVGRNNPSPEAVEVASARRPAAGTPPPPSGPPLVVDPKMPAEGTSKPSPAPVEPAKTPLSKEPAPAETKPPETAAVKPRPAPEAPPAKPPEKPAAAPPPAVKPAEKPASASTSTPPAPPPTAPAEGAVQEPVKGCYLQVAAIDRTGADILAQSLAKKSFSAVIAPGPTSTLFRVLVGPIEKGQIPQKRADLEAVGLKGPIRREYKGGC